MKKKRWDISKCGSGDQYDLFSENQSQEPTEKNRSWWEQDAAKKSAQTS